MLRQQVCVLTQQVADPFHLHEDGVMQQAVEQRGGHHRIAEHQVLRLLEIATKEVVAAAMAEAIHLGAIGFDAVRQIVLARIERRPARLDLLAYPYLPGTEVRMTRAADYAALVQEQAA